MEQIDKYIQELTSIKDGESWVWPESDYGRAEIFKVLDMFIVFSIPMYGGEPIYEKTCRKEDINEMMEMVARWS